MLFYASKMAMAIAFNCINAVEALILFPLFKTEESHAYIQEVPT